LLGLSLLGLAVIWGVHPFLAVNKKVTTDILVVEGWVNQYAIDAAVAEFTNGSYHRVFTTGGPVHGSGPYSNDYNTSASVGAGRLRNAGVPAAVVVKVPSRVRDRDRTYSAALALRDWLAEHQVETTAINLVTEDVHARRSRLLFQKALGKRVRVGIIAVANPDYDAKHWWRYSEGVKEIISEGAAYIYARFFFYP
jgi:uncharacterized SAM-binding protein YcdF (DUF218 family)